MKKVNPVLVLLFLFLQAADAQTAMELNTERLAENLYLIANIPKTGNVAFLITAEGVLLVDSGASRETGFLIRQEIEKITSLPVRYIVLTHSHGDHIYGLSAFGSEAEIIAQQNTQKNIRLAAEELQKRIENAEKELSLLQKELTAGKSRSKKREELIAKADQLQNQLRFWKDIVVVGADILLEKGKLTISLGGQKVEVIYPGPAHIDDNLLVWFPDQRVIHCGDLIFNGYHPFIDFQRGADSANWIKILKELACWQQERVIPGHGNPGDAEIIAR